MVYSKSVCKTKQEIQAAVDVTPNTLGSGKFHQHNEVKNSSKTGGFKCDGRTMCSQMTSCEEATFFIQNCPNTKMDGGRSGEHPNGVPCEKQWCNK